MRAAITRSVVISYKQHDTALRPTQFQTYYSITTLALHSSHAVAYYSDTTRPSPLLYYSSVSTLSPRFSLLQYTHFMSQPGAPIVCMLIVAMCLATLAAGVTYVQPNPLGAEDLV